MRKQYLREVVKDWSVHALAHIVKRMCKTTNINVVVVQNRDGAHHNITYRCTISQTCIHLQLTLGAAAAVATIVNFVKGCMQGHV